MYSYYMLTIILIIFTSNQSISIFFLIIIHFPKIIHKHHKDPYALGFDHIIYLLNNLILNTLIFIPCKIALLKYYNHYLLSSFIHIFIWVSAYIIYLCIIPFLYRVFQYSIYIWYQNFKQSLIILIFINYLKGIFKDKQLHVHIVFDNHYVFFIIFFSFNCFRS
jgi:hypothetical protein